MPKFTRSPSALLGYLLLTLCHVPVGFTEPTAFEPGAYIVDLGRTPQTEANALRPYGMVYEIVGERIPVSWAFSEDKVSNNEIDFVADNQAYRSSAFIISADFAPYAAPLIATWRQRGVQVDGPTQNGFVAPVFGIIRGMPSAGLDEDNGAIVEGYFSAASLPNSIYRTILPRSLDGACDDIFYLPHADPTWPDHGRLRAFVSGGGFLWGACHAVSVLENVVDPNNPAEGAALNFLTNDRLALYRRDPVHPSHEDGTPPYNYSPNTWSAPVMQFLGDIDDSTTGGSEQIYLPAGGSSWRDSTEIAIWDPDHDNLLSEGANISNFSEGEAAVLALGRGYGIDTSGLVVYHGGHRHDERPNAQASIASRRIVMNLLIQATLERGIQVDIDNPPSEAPTGEATTLQVNGISGGVPPYTVDWLSSCGGQFNQLAEPLTTEWIPPANRLGEQCMITAQVSDACNNDRIGFYSMVVLVTPPNESPVITRLNGANQTDYQQDEGIVLVGIIEATDAENDPITFALTNGGDSALFSIDPLTGELRFNGVPNYEDPLDGNQDNVYEFEVTATDGNGTDSQQITVTILDVDEDRDGDGLLDSAETALGTDPTNPDTDGDGINDGTELGGDGTYDVGIDTNPLDADTDDDGLSDGDEIGADGERDPARESDALNPDTDGDGIQDGTENGAAAPIADPDGAGPLLGTDPAVFVRDQDPTTTTDPLNADTDAGGIADGVEDADQNGRIDANEGDPNNPADDDSDGDGISDNDETALGTDPANPDTDGDGINDGDEVGRDGTYEVGTDTNPLDADTDDDGLSDGDEIGADGERDPAQETDALNADTDGDGIQDGTESGVTNPIADPDGDGPLLGTDLAIFIADQDASTTTDPLNADTDAGGVDDGVEDADQNGRIDANEGDPNNPADDDSDGDRIQDTDGDGLPDDIEEEIGTDPNNPDTDGDGLPDGVEVGDDQTFTPGEDTDPLNPDTDGDGLLDGVEDADLDGEVDLGETDPNNPDTDGGGLLDGDEVASGDDPLDPDDDRVVSVQGGGCSTVTAPSGLAPLWILLAILYIRRRRLRLQYLALALPLFALVPDVQAQGFEAQNFRPATDQEIDYLHVQSAQPTYGTRFSLGLFSHYVNDSLVVLDSNEKRLGSLIGGQLTSHLLANFAFYDRFRLGIDLPFILYQSGDKDIPVTGGLSTHDFGVGTARFVIQTHLFTQTTPKSATGSSLSFALDVGLPTGDDTRLQSDGWRVEPRLLYDYVFSSGHSIGANLGYEFRNRFQLINLEVDDTLNFNLASRFLINEKFALIPEVNSRIGVAADTLDAAETPVEGLVALRYAMNAQWMFNAGGGMGLTNGYGAPDWRVFLGVSTAETRGSDKDCDGIDDSEDQCPDQPEDKDLFQDTDGCPDPDNDLDKVVDVVDSCPLEPEDRDGFEDHDGCPDPDNDKDGILDVNDKCPLLPEDRDGFEDEDGCPDLDNDKDGILDTVDQCPQDPEDLDKFEDENGCPDPDNDRDKILDVADKCPIDPENYNGYEDSDGCPDRQIVTVTCDRIDFKGKIYFATSKSIIRKRSFTLLKAISDTLSRHHEIKSVRIEGHTDNVGADSYNLTLSDARAAAVLKHLTEAGIATNRLVSKGFGEKKPIRPNSTRAGRAENRRVEFVILERTGCD